MSDRRKQIEAEAEKYSAISKREDPVATIEVTDQQLRTYLIEACRWGAEWADANPDTPHADVVMVPREQAIEEVVGLLKNAESELRKIPCVPEAENSCPTCDGIERLRAARKTVEALSRGGK